MKIGIIVAMEKELQLLQDMVGGDSCVCPQAATTVGADSCVCPQAATRCSSPTVVVRLCGIGKVNAAIGCASLIAEEHPDMIVSFGCAGGCGDGVHVGDVVVGTATAYHDVYCGSENDYGQVQGLPARFTADSLMVRWASLSATSGQQGAAHEGLIVSGDWFVDTKEKMAGITAHFPDAIAVDMESAAIAQTCHVFGVPFIALRIVSDVPLSDEHANQYSGFWENISGRTFTIASDFIKRIKTNIYR